MLMARRVLIFFKMSVHRKVVADKSWHYLCIRRRGPREVMVDLMLKRFDQDTHINRRCSAGP